MQNDKSYERTPQARIHSGFGPSTTTRDVLRGHDLTNKTAIVTGGYSGIGLETTRALAEAGATVVVPVRTLEKARASMGGIARVELEQMDLIDAASVDAFAQRFLSSGRALHVLINNAGIMAPPLSRDTRGYESQFATNHLGHFQLTVRLWPALKRAGRSGGARVVALSSSGIRFGTVDFDDPNYQRRPYDRWNAYGQSKTANALFRRRTGQARPQGRRPGLLGAPGRNPDGLVSFHDGGREARLHRTAQDDRAGGGDQRVVRDELSAGRQGRRVLSGLRRGRGRRAPSPGRSDRMLDGVIPWAVDPDSAERLWKLSEEMTGVKIDH
jgi:NAD(P)-dependent dehydrogenase (short-subunit alcohol dehydrogenase family)